MSNINSPVLAHDEITLEFEQEDERVLATIFLARNNTLSQLVREYLTIAKALQKAKALATERGFGGYYEIKHPEHLGKIVPQDMAGAFEEIADQVSELTSRAKGSTYYTAEHITMNAQIARLDNLRSALSDAI